MFRLIPNDVQLLFAMHFLSSYYRFNNNFQQQISRDTWREPFSGAQFSCETRHAFLLGFIFFFQRRFPSISRTTLTTGLHNFQRKPPRKTLRSDKNNTTKKKRNNNNKTETVLSFYSHPIILRSSLTSTHQRPPVLLSTTLLYIILLLLYMYYIIYEHFGGPSA